MDYINPTALVSKVFIGVGHGGSDPGAVANGLKESEVNLNMALALQKELVRHGATVGISRTTEENDPLAKKIKKCNTFGPDLAVEVHNNAGGGDGFEVYYQTGTYKPRSLAIAQAIEAEVKLIGQNSRGCKTKLNASGADYFGWLREVKAPAVLCEGAFLDNKTDVQIIDTLAEQQAFGVAYAKGVLAYLGIPYKAENAPMYGVMKQVIALGDYAKAIAYASELNAKGEKDVFYKVLPV